MRILVCEDEPITAARIERLARKQEGVVDVQVRDTGCAARTLLELGDVDIALLDINLPDMSGFDVARTAIKQGCQIVFITAYDDHAVHAFDIGAIDYLLKPIERSRFADMFARVREQSRRRTDTTRREELERIVAQLRDARGNNDYIHDFWIKERDRRFRVPVETVEYMEAARDYIILHTPGRKHMIRRTMADVEKQLDPTVMLRVHRSYFVNLNEIKSLLSEEGRTTSILLGSGDEVPIGPAYQSALRLALRR